MKEYLEEGEEVLVEARQSRFKAGGRLFFPEVVAATNKKLIIVHPLPFGRRDVQVIYYKNISGVRLRKGFLSCAIEFEVQGVPQNGFAEVSAIRCSDAEKILEAIQKHESG
jgi:hypothetical protein